MYHSSQIYTINYLCHGSWYRTIDSIYSIPRIGNCNYFTRYADLKYPAYYCSSILNSIAKLSNSVMTSNFWQRNDSERAMQKLGKVSLHTCPLATV